jgi:antirestriction protein ArdC
MKLEAATKLADQGIEDLATALAAGQSETLTKYLGVIAKFHNYSMQNCMMIACQRPDATHVAGFHAWLKLGRHVIKGETGIAILAPVVYRGKELDDDTQERKSVVKGFRVVHVFDISQTDGEPLPEFATVSGRPGELIAQLELAIANADIALAYEPIAGAALGMSSDGAITIQTGLEPAETFAILVHEYSHEILHKGERRCDTTKQVRETEAEAVSFVVCQAFGMDSTTRSADYIQLYRGTTETLAESLDFIKQTAAQIITELQADAKTTHQHIGG